ncbi:MAG: imidazole glycerol phosphate synthase subunit HisH [Deltaproteobacteria bacterium]|nr:MAG: imidazole glycerol phosphate synthase subunit HisH [Deltaproteobacteria bacterium]
MEGIAIVDYGAGNLTSVQRALKRLNIRSEITKDPSSIIKADRIIFPGVGAAGRAMQTLRISGIDDALRMAFKKGIPILGICLGIQIIMERSDEDGVECLGIIPGEVKRFPEDLRDKDGERLKVPHMGWNRVSLKRSHPLFEGISPDHEFYFVHSYYPCPREKEHIIGETEYGIIFCSVVAKDNFAALQFHPEKSGRPGLKILENFSCWDGQSYA